MVLGVNGGLGGLDSIEVGKEEVELGFLYFEVVRGVFWVK